MGMKLRALHIIIHQAETNNPRTEYDVNIVAKNGGTLTPLNIDSVYVDENGAVISIVVDMNGKA